MTKDFLSIIIPAYNPDETVFRRLLATLNEQIGDRDNVEIVVVDDGSDIGLSLIVSEYKHIVYVRQINLGEPSARNTGIELAQGEYIQFIDADDEIIGDCVSIVLENMRQGYDWVSYDWKCDNHKEWAQQTSDPLMINCAVWAYSFRAEMFKTQRFNPSLRLGCDTDWLGRALKPEQKHMHDHRIFYNYRWCDNENSLCHRKIRGEIV